jgi:hypothetical protein
MGSKAKLSVNSMIGCFKPKVRENWRSLLITTNPNAAYAHFLDKKGCFIDTRRIGDETYYQVYDRYFSNREESEAPIYNQILELEAIEVHKLKVLLESKGGLVLDVSTDCLSCVFKNNESPFKLINDTYIDGYFHGAQQKTFKYRKEDKEGRLKVERLKMFIKSSIALIFWFTLRRYCRTFCPKMSMRNTGIQRSTSICAANSSSRAALQR